ncbi:hypothetical protein DAQ1742_04120 [Dickeya aquatica]|uniref:Uncharacterized protein n=1 Tax=Dickeya aquatica TaxID=1401087 RepID=A0A375AFR6_9GAMM|nr:hypothetical protein DAQ1742_04120 [Dickeya aquatica]
MKTVTSIDSIFTVITCLKVRLPACIFIHHNVWNKNAALI